MSVSMLGGPFNAAGAIVQGQMTSQSLQNQANLQLSQATEAEAAGAYNATRQQMLASQKIGTSTAAYGAAGVTGSSGSVQDVLASSAANAELDRLNILHGADVKAINYENQAALDNYGAASAVYGSEWQAIGSITGGAIQGMGNQVSSSPPPASGEGAGDAADGAEDVSGDGGYAGADAAGEAAGEGAGLSDLAAIA